MLVLMVFVPSIALSEESTPTDGCDVELGLIHARIDEANAKYRSVWFKSGDLPDGTHSGEAPPAEVYASIVAELRASGCYPADIKEKMINALEKIAKAVEQLRSREAKCRKSKTCMDRRKAIPFAIPICDLHDDRSMTQRSIAHERANPTGVVNLRELHDLGRHLQDLDIVIRGETAEFFTKYSVRFDLKMCSELPKDADGNYITPETQGDL